MTNRRLRLAGVGVVLAGMLACNADVPTSALPMASMADGEGAEASARAQLDLRVEREALLATDRAFSAAAAGVNAAEGLLGPLADDVVFVLGPNHVIGAAAVRAALEANPLNLAANWQWTVVRGDVSTDGRSGYTYGYTTLALPDGRVFPGKYVAFWHKQPDGQWRMTAYKRVGRPAGDVSLTPPPGFATPDTKHRRYFPNTEPETERLALMAADQAFSDLASAGPTGAAFAANVASDGAALAGFAEIAYGADLIAESYDSFAPGELVWTPEIADAAGTGDMAFTTGTFFVRMRAEDGTWQTIQAGKYLTVWQKQDTGVWKFVIDG